MVTRLNYNTVPRISNFYESSFKQLSDIQQKQTGLIIGAVVADAAARALDGCTADEIAEFVKEQLKLNDKKELEEEPFVFARSGPQRLSSSRLSASIRHNSYTCLFVKQLLRVMASARGDFPVTYVKDNWVSIARANPECFAEEHASLLHVMGVVLLLPVIYPWADDVTLRSYATPFIDFLTEPPPGRVLDAMEETSRSAVRLYTFSALGVALRCLQSNPNPYLNAAMMAAPGTAGIFPDDLASFCPLQANSELQSLTASVDLTRSAIGANTTVPLRGSSCGKSVPFTTTTTTTTTTGVGGSSSLSLFPARLLVQDVRVVREGLTVARQARTFEDGVRASIRLGGPVCQRSLIVGALLGARLGVRRIPSSWLSATHDYSSLATMAMEVAQWSWNPPHH